MTEDQMATDWQTVEAAIAEGEPLAHVIAGVKNDAGCPWCDGRRALQRLRTAVGELGEERDRLREALRIHHEALYHNGGVTPQQRDATRALLEETP